MSDVAESRRYSVSDVAGNTLDLCLNVRCQLDEYEVVVQRILYKGKELRKIPLIRNTITFRRLRGVNGARGRCWVWCSRLALVLGRRDVLCELYGMFTWGLYIVEMEGGVLLW